jgi:hypothetical protein
LSAFGVRDLFNDEIVTEAIVDCIDCFLSIMRDEGSEVGEAR